MMQNKTQWISPSNIAIVKYWGKHADQIPMNPSVSFTLSESHTNTSVFWSPKSANSLKRFQFYFEGKEKPSFEPKIDSFLQKLDVHLPWLKNWFLEINSTNSFPHSSGIASSASAMSALALCVVSQERNLFPESMVNEEYFLQRSSWFARMGSGSACRSMFPVAGLWGKLQNQAGSSDEFAVGLANQLNPVFHTYRDYIFIVSAHEKSVSSSAGHALMDQHFFKEGRLLQADHHLNQLLPSLQAGDLEKFMQICETEAMTLHGLMMSSHPYYLLLEADSLRILHAIRQLRQAQNIPVCFTIDAGPNIHLLFPQECVQVVEKWIQDTLPEYLEDGKLIRDQVGSGPICLS